MRGSLLAVVLAAAASLAQGHLQSTTHTSRRRASHWCLRQRQRSCLVGSLGEVTLEVDGQRGHSEVSSAAGSQAVAERLRWGGLSVGAGAAAVALRGGADDEDDEFDEDVADEDFEEGAVGNRIGQLWARTPYLTKRFFYVSFALTAYAFVFNKNAWPKLLDLEWDKVFRGQIWRVAATFFCFGALGLNCIISMYFVWTYMGELERMYFKRPQDFAMLMGFGALCLLVFTSLMGIHGQFLGHSLSCYLVYIWSREYEGVEVNVNDMFSLKAELLPWFFVAQTLVLEGEVPLLDLLGIFVGYLYMQLKIRKLIKAPEFVTQFFKIPAIAKDYKRFEREFGVENAGFDAAAAGVDADASEDSEGDSSADESGEHSEE